MYTVYNFFNGFIYLGNWKLKFSELMFESGTVSAAEEVMSVESDVSDNVLYRNSITTATAYCHFGLMMENHKTNVVRFCLLIFISTVQTAQTQSEALSPLYKLQCLKLGGVKSLLMSYIYIITI